MSDEEGRDASYRVTSQSLNIARPVSCLALFVSRTMHCASLLGHYATRITYSTSLSASLLLLLLLAGCAIPQVPSRIVYEDPVNFVRLELDPGVLPEWPPTHHAHPAQLEPETLRAALAGMQIQEHRMAIQRWIQGAAPLVPAFTEEEVAILTEHVAEAFARAHYNERVTFYLSQPQTSARRVITTGGLYMRDSMLHVLLGNWQIMYGIPAYGMIYDRRYPMRPTAAKGFDLLFEQREAVIPVKNSWLDILFANSTDELVIDLHKVKVPDPIPSGPPRSPPPMPPIPMPPAKQIMAPAA